MAGRAVSTGGRSPTHVRTANDGSLQERGQSDDNRDTAVRHSTLLLLLLSSGKQQKKEKDQKAQDTVERKTYNPTSFGF